MRSLPTILLAALVARLALFLFALPDEERFFTSDAYGYVALADDLRAGYLQPESPLFVAGLSRTPGYPLFVAAVLGPTGRASAVIVVQILLALVTVWLTFQLGREWLSDRAAATGAFLLALAPASVIYANQLQPEVPFTALVTGAVLAWVRAVHEKRASLAAVAGLGLGLALLTRPLALFLPAVLLAWSWRSPARARLGAALLAPVLLCAGGWVARNAAVTGVPLLSTIQGVNLLEYRAAGAVALGTGVPLALARDQLRERLAAALPAGANPAEVSRAQSRLALEVLREHPGAWAQTTALGAVRLLAGTGQTALARISGDADPESSTTLALPLTLAVVVLLLGAAAGAIRLWREGPRSALTLLAGVAAYFIVVSAGPEANTRFRVPAEPFLGLLAGAGFAGALPRAAAGRARTAAPRLEAS